VILALVGAAFGKGPAPPPPPDFWSPAGLERALDEVLPAIERQSGRTFHTRPKVELSAPDAFARILAEEEQLVLDAVSRDTPPELRRPAQQSGVVPGLLGKYAVFDDTLYLCRDEIFHAAAELGLPDPVAIARPILVHELVHALHDQQTDLAAQLRAVPDLDGFRANQATAEGLATWVTERVAKDLGFSQEARQLERLQGWDEGALVEKEKFPIWAAYGLGRNAMQAHFEAGGLDRVWQVAITPPASSRGVFEPARAFEPRAAPSRDWAAVLRGAERKLTDADWIVSISLLGDYDLVGEAIVGDNVDALREVAAHLLESWHLVGALPDRDGEIRVLRFDGPTWPMRYLELLEAQEASAAARVSVPGVSEVDITFTPWPKMPGDRAVLRDSRLAGAPGVFTERHAGWVVRGDTLVVVTAGRFRPGLRLGWTVEEVFSRLATPPTPPP
jgi:hypothetical protein